MGSRAGSEPQVRRRYWLACIRLWVKDVDFVHNQIVVRDGKGHKDWVTMVPQHIKAPLPRHLHDVHKLHAQALQTGAGHAYLPYALEHKSPIPVTSGCGYISFLLHSRHEIHGQAASGAVTFTNWSCSGQYRRLSGRQGSPRRRVVTLFATVLPSICLKQGVLSGQYKNYSGIKMSVRR